MKVAIAWYGLEGQESYRYYAAQGHDVTIVTPAVAEQFPIPDGAKLITGPDAFDHLNGFDLVIRSAGTRPDALQTDGKIWSSTNEFFAKCPAPIIGVTGTKGKGTTSSLIAELLRAGGQKTYLVGNIGLPALSVLSEITENDIVVFEMSSFQLWDLEKSPHVAVVLMIEPDHLDVHRNFTEYVEAKSNIRRYQANKDRCLYHPTNHYSQQIAESGTHAGSAYRFGIPDDHQAYVSGGSFYYDNEELCATSVMQIPGQHNIENACAAISAAKACLPSLSPAHIQTALAGFTGLPHRLKYVRQVDGVSYYDDSIATTPGSAMAALDAFKQPKILILGGSDKGASYNDVIEKCRSTKTVVIAIGQTGEAIASLCKQYGVECLREPGMMNEVVKAAAHKAKKGDVIILSPASASFDQYKNYGDRGDAFVKEVEGL